MNTKTYDPRLTIYKALMTALWVFVGGGLARSSDWFSEHYGTIWCAPLVMFLLAAAVNWVKNRNKGK